MKTKRMQTYIKNAALRTKNAMGFVMVCILIFVFAAFGLIYANSCKNIKQQAVKNVQSSLAQSKSKLELCIIQGVDNLNTLSEIIANMDTEDTSKVAAVLASGNDGTIFETLGIRYDDGRTLSDDDSFVNIAEWGEETSFDAENIKADVGALAMSAWHGKQVVRIFVPINSMVQQNAKIFGEIDDAKLAKYFFQTQYGPKCDVIVFESKTGNVIMKTGNNLDLGAQKIGVLGSHGQESKRIFKDIIKNKSGYTDIETQKENITCVYTPIGIGDWYMMYAVPEDMLLADFKNTSLDLVYVLFVAVISMLLLSLYAYKKIRHVKDDADIAVYDIALKEKIVSQALSETSIRVFLYYKAENKIVVLKDADGTYKANTVVGDGTDYIAEYEKLDANDTRRMRNIIALTGADGNIKLAVCSHRTNPGTLLKYTFSAVKNTSGEDYVIVCTATEVSDTGSQKVDLENFKNSVVAYKTTGLELFLESNRWRCVWNNEPVMDSKVTPGKLQSNYDSDLKKKILPEVKSQDRQIFEKNMNRLNLLEYFRSGKNEFSFDYHMKTTKPFPYDYELRIMDIHLLRDKKTDEVKANVYIRNVDTALSDND